MKKVKPPYNEKTHIRASLRMAWRRHPNLQIVLKRDRIERPYVKKDGSVSSRPRVFYKCVLCEQEFKQPEIQIDHDPPVGPTPGSKLAPPDLTWDEFISRMFCRPENLKIVCKPCHSRKSKEDNARLRAANADRLEQV